MNELQIYNLAIFIWLGTGIIAGIGLFFISAPYGRHVSKKWGPLIPARLAWFLMESPSPILMALFFLTGHHNIVAIAFIAMWEIHYLQRTFIYPVLMSPKATAMPVFMLFSGILFNLVNVYFNGRWIFHLSPEYNASWLIDLRFIIGVLIFLLGFFINLQSDAILRNLRKLGKRDYKIPRGGLYHWVSTPNYLGEILEWLGWALATWSMAGLIFFFWTVANLLPRAISNHRWYRKNFTDYPMRRRVLVPFLF